MTASPNLLKLCLYTATLLLSACSSKPYIDYDTDYPFARAQTFFIVPSEVDNDPLMAPRVQAAIDEELRARGLQPVTERPRADLAVSYTLSAEDRPNNNRVSVGLGTGSVGSSGGVAVGGTVSRPVGGDTRRFTIIQIDMQPGADDRLIWRGRDALEPRGDPMRRAEEAHRLVRRLLAAFPPGA